MKTVTLFKPEDFQGFSQFSKETQEGLQSYLESLNEILNDMDYWDWKPLITSIVKPLWHSLNLNPDSIEENFYIFKFAVPDYLYRGDIIFKEIHNLLDDGDGEDIPAKIRITSSEEIHLITVTKYFTI